MKLNDQDEECQLAELARLREAAWPANVARTPSYPFGEVPLTEYLRLWAERQPDKPAIVFYGGVLTFGELEQQSNRLARLLASLGVSPGDRVAVFLPNCPQFLIAFYGILKAGAVHVSVNPLYKEGEFVHQVNDAGAKVVISADYLIDIVRACRARTGLREVIVTSVSEALPERPTLPLPPSLSRSRQACPDAIDLLPALAQFSGDSIAPPAGALDAVAALNYTGGTTGIPKGCIHTQRDMLYTAATTCGCVEPMGSSDTGICFNPVFWIAGEDWAVVFPVFAGASCVLLARWDPLAFLMAVDRYKVTHSGGTVDSAIELMNHPRAGEFDLRSLRSTRVVSFVKPLTIEVRNRWRALTGATLIEATYGSTETHTMDTFTRGMQDGDFDLSDRPLFVGLPVPGTELKVCDFETHELKPLGVEGEICIRTPSLMKGYWQKPEESAACLRNGWFLTGDIGVLDEKGYLHFLGRHKEMLKVKGMSVFPSEVESILQQHPAIQRSGVIGIPDPEKGEQPMAFVVLTPPWVGKTTPDELEQWCRANMAIYKVPAIRIVEALPMTDTGKVKRGEIKRLHGLALSSAGTPA